MRARSLELQGLLELPSLRDERARRASFRQAFATLAREAVVEGPSPLEGVAVDALAHAVKVALEDGLFDELDWLSPAAAGVALFELAGALPQGNEKRDLGRRVLGRLHEAPADAFAAIATRMALGSRNALAGSSMRARVGLLFSTPTVDAGTLAFAIVSRRELAREWIVAASTRSLPARRLAARIVERAALVAARRASLGDDYAPRVFSTEAVAPAFARLLADREPLVWRHAAVARGVLAGVVGPQWKAASDALHPRLSPTEWRRGAVSIAAAIATAPDRALPRASDLIDSALAQTDRGLVATMAWGLPRALEAEPEAAEKLLEAIVAVDPIGAAEPVAVIAREAGGDVAKDAVQRVRHALQARTAKPDDDGEDVVARALAAELSDESSMASTTESSVRDSVVRALRAWTERGAREAHGVAKDALQTARDALSTLEGLDAANDARARRASVLVLRDLDAALLEDSALEDLLQLRLPANLRALNVGSGTHSAVEETAMGPLEELHERLARWILSRERDPKRHGSSGRRLRALLRLLDAESGTSDAGDDSPRAVRARRRRWDAISLLFSRLVSDRRSPLHRTLCAALARALDALVREGTCDPVDVLVIAAANLDDANDHDTLAEASMDPDVGATLEAWAKFARAGGEEPIALVTPSTRGAPDPLASLPPPTASTDDRIASSIAARLEALLELAAALGDDASGRAEALRSVLVRAARGLRTIEASTSRKSFADAAPAFEALGAALQSYAQMDQGARQRVLGNDPSSLPATVAGLGAYIATLLGHLADPSLEDAHSAIDDAKIAIARLVPTPLKKLVVDVLDRALDRPFEATGVQLLTKPKVAAELPSWLGPRRTLGGFFVVRPLGGGAAASVFVAKRLEERNDANAEQFALKVPDYDGAAARSLSEQEFLAFFRGEASALLGLPPSPNLARFVTFDLAARPKPILVMELIQGPTLERFVTAGTRTSATVARAFDLLDGILAGLEVMHAHAIGHLDLKPSNVILRDARTPTLVDFGLSGRQIRPGCATGPYGAPEVWGALPDDFTGQPSPLPADVYAFGALAFEVLTGQTLFAADTEVAIIGQHLAHDGHPAGLDRLRAVRPLVELLQHTLRRDPRARWSVPQVRGAMKSIAPHLKNTSWPLGA